MIHYVPPGKWLLDVRHEGRRIRRTITGSKADARYLESFLERHGYLPSTEVSSPAHVTLGQVVRHCATIKWTQLQTRRQLETRASQICAVLGESVSIDSLGREHYATLRKALEDHGDAPGTIRKKLELLRQILTEAHAMGWRVAAPDLRGMLPQEHIKTRTLQPAEEHQLLAHASPEFGQLLVTLVDTGMRLGELLATTVDDIQQGGTVLRVATLKGGVPRTLPLTARVQSILKIRAEAVGDGPLWAGWDQARVSYQWKILRAQTGVQGVSSHTLRHTCATRLLGSVDIRIVQSWLGHRSITTTARYTHTTPAHLEQARNILEG